MKTINIFFGLAAAIMLSGCADVLDKTNVESISEDAVWGDVDYAEAYLNKLYVDNLPSWDSGVGGDSDEAEGNSSKLYGTLTAESISELYYSNIRSINILLENLESSSFDEDTKVSFKAQALVLRAWRYFQMVRNYGGVPLVMTVQSLNDDLFVSRNKTSECIDAIIDDLDYAIANLPKSWDSDNTGRFTRATAYALKGRVLLYYASEQFNPDNDISRWQTAYDFHKTAITQIEADGYGLYDDYKNIWFDEDNCEALMVKKYQEPDLYHNWDAATRPLSEAQNATGANHPTLELVNSYPMITGESIEESSLYNSTYYWLNRDPRFKATVAYNGCLWELSGKTGRIQWTYAGAEQNSPTTSGFYCRKAINESYTPYYTERSSTDWIEIRYAEVLLNFAECAAATGHSDEAYDVLKRIRSRAGIQSGSDGMYGLKSGMTGNTLTSAIMLERKIELAFEGKRYWDLRRRRMFGENNYAPKLNDTQRTGLEPHLKSGYSISDIEAGISNGTIDLDKDYATYFEDQIVLTDKVYKINFKDEYYFYAIPSSELEVNPNLKQTQGWSGGTFNPLD